MAWKNVTLGVLAAAALTSTSLLSQTQKPDCGAVVDQAQREMRQLSADAALQSVKFVSDVDLEEQFDNAKRVLALRNPGQAARDEIQRLKERAEAYRAKIRSYAEFMADLNTCFRPYDSACVQRVAGQQDALVKEWLNALTDYTTADAAERVRKAAQLITAWHDRAFNMATGTMTASVSCLTAFQQQIPATTTPAAAPAAPAADAGVPDIPEPPAKPVNPPQKGSSFGAPELAAAAAGLGTVGVLVAVHAQKNADGGGSNNNSSCRQPTSNPLTICANQGGGSTACQQALSDWNAYCRNCRNSSGFNTQSGSCR